MKIAIAYLEDKLKRTEIVYEKALKMNEKKKYLNFLETKIKDFKEALKFLNENKNRSDSEGK